MRHYSVVPGQEQRIHPAGKWWTQASGPALLWAGFLLCLYKRDQFGVDAPPSIIIINIPFLSVLQETCSRQKPEQGSAGDEEHVENCPVIGALYKGRNRALAAKTAAHGCLPRKQCEKRGENWWRWNQCIPRLFAKTGHSRQTRVIPASLCSHLNALQYLLARLPMMSSLWYFCYTSVYGRQGTCAPVTIRHRRQLMHFLAIWLIWALRAKEGHWGGGGLYQGYWISWPSEILPFSMKTPALFLHECYGGELQRCCVLVKGQMPALQGRHSAVFYSFLVHVSSLPFIPHHTGISKSYSGILWLNGSGHCGSEGHQFQSHDQ